MATELQNRFLFLKADYPDLYELCNECEKYVASDSSVALLKARQALEYIVLYFQVDKKTLFQAIGVLSDKGIIPANIASLFHFVRRTANNAIHMTSEDVSGFMPKIADALFEIGIWLSVVKEKHTYSNAIFQNVADRKLYINAVGKKDRILHFDRINIDKEPGTYKPFSEEDFYDEPQDILEKSVFETDEEYKARIEQLDGVHFGYAILNMESAYKKTDIVFARYHVEKNEKIIFSDEVALYAYAQDIKGLMADGELVAGLKVVDNKIYFDYDKISLKNYNDDNIVLHSLSWKKYSYETNEERVARLDNMQLLPVAACVPVCNSYDIKSEKLPFKASIMKYAADILSLDEMVVQIDRENARILSGLHEEMICYARIVYDARHDIFSGKDFLITDKKCLYNLEAVSLSEPYNVLDRDVEVCNEIVKSNADTAETAHLPIKDNEYGCTDSFECNKDKSGDKYFCRKKIIVLLAVLIVVIGTWLFNHVNPSDGVQDLDNQSLYVVDAQEEREDVTLKIGTIGGIKLRQTMIDDVESVYGKPTAQKNASQWSDYYLYGMEYDAPFEVYYNRENRTVTGIIVRKGAYQNIKTSKGLGLFNTLDEMKAAYGEPDSMEDSVSGKKYVYIQNDELLEFWENPGEGIVAMHSMIYAK